MLAGKGKISVRQIFWIFIIVNYTLITRDSPASMAMSAKQASWLSVFVGIPFPLILIFIFNSIYKSYKNKTFIEIAEDIAGKFIGKIIVIVHIILITFLIALFVKIFGQRINTTIYPLENEDFFIIPILILTALVVRKGITVIARINDIVFPVVTIVILILSLLIMPGIKLSNLTPITYKDILPVISASPGIIGGWILLFYLLLLCDRVSDKENLKKIGFQSTILITCIIVFIIICIIGSMGYSVVQRETYTLINATKQISFLGILDRLESLLVATMIISDFIFFSIFTSIDLYLLKTLFKLKEEKHLVIIYILLMFFLCKSVGRNFFEIQVFVKYIGIPILSIAACFITALFLLIVGKVRKKI